MDIKIGKKIVHASTGGRQPRKREEAIILIHGAGMNRTAWQLQTRNLSHRGFQTYALDLPGHGRSDGPSLKNIEEMANWLNKVLEIMKINQATIIGHSMGGKIAMKCLQDHPNKFNKAIIIDIAPKRYENHHENILTVLQSANLFNYNNRSSIDSYFSAFIDNPLTRQLLQKNIKRNDNNMFDWRCNGQAIIANYSEIMKAGITNTPIHHPSLFIKGKNSSYINTEDETKIKQLFPLSTIETIENASHWVHADQPQHLISIINRYLK